MTSNAPSPHSFSYIDCDVPAGKTLTEWRREREAARRAERPRHRTWLIAPRRLRWSP